MDLIPISFIAGALTILAPCVLPILPVIIGGTAGHKSKIRPVIITASLALSIFFFTLLLKATTYLIAVPQGFWSTFSGIIILFFALSMIFPDQYAKIVSKIFSGKIEHKFQKIAFNQSKKDGHLSAILLGISLGPIFAACSPTYALILGTVLPASFFVGILNLIAYSIGLAGVMFVVAYASQKYTSKLNWAANPHGIFKKTLGVVLLFLAIAIFTGYDKVFETWLLNFDLFSFSTSFEGEILRNANKL